MSDQKNLTQTTTTRRAFVQTGGAIAATGLAGAAYSRPRRDSLALDGGSKAVAIPATEHKEITRWPRLGQREKDAIARLIDANSYYDELGRFEEDWKNYLGAAYVKSHGNCTSALTSMFFAIDLPPGSEIMTPSYTFFATILPMRFFGYVPIFIDVDPRTCCFDLEDARRKLTSRTKAMIPMHAWGLPCEMDRIGEFAREHGLLVLEDAAQAHGASMQGKKVGTWGSIGAFSFQQSKVLPTIEGGVGVYQTEQLYERATAFGHYEAVPHFAKGSPNRKYEGTGFGQKYRMHPFAAAVARTQLRSLDERNALVASQVRKLNDRLLALPGLSEPRCRPDQTRAYYYANMLFLDEAKAGFSRDNLVKALQAEGVRASVWIYPEQHKFKIYSEEKWWHHKPDVPNVLNGCEQVNRTHIFLALMYQEAPELIDQYVKAFEKIWAGRERVRKG
ncbi:MAG: DegT/DnrJ/EryC1/StrS family aminotransferase [Bryobacteraceae bacterium]|nr:DegT/DnrJ/EryC1/StrS family aminotransferase [Bryobacteraceae bacterium]